MTDEYIKSGKWLRYDRCRLIAMLDDYRNLLHDESPHGSMEVFRQIQLLEKAERDEVLSDRMAPDDYKPVPDAPVPMEDGNE